MYTCPSCPPSDPAAPPYVHVCVGRGAVCCTAPLPVDVHTHCASHQAHTPHTHTPVVPSTAPTCAHCRSPGTHPALPCCTAVHCSAAFVLRWMQYGMYTPHGNLQNHHNHHHHDAHLVSHNEQGTPVHDGSQCSAPALLLLLLRAAPALAACVAPPATAAVATAAAHVAPPAIAATFLSHPPPPFPLLLRQEQASVQVDTPSSSCCSGGG